MIRPPWWRPIALLMAVLVVGTGCRGAVIGDDVEAGDDAPTAVSAEPAAGTPASGTPAPADRVADDDTETSADAADADTPAAGDDAAGDDAPGSGALDGDGLADLENELAEIERLLDEMEQSFADD
ncbi:MAG: hypothetical protein AAF962_11670 [Actinomycetota bacterium]